MNHSSSAQDVAHILAGEIDALPAGSRVPSHRELVRRFEVSATTVSHALALLTQRGLVASRPGAGTFRTDTRTPTAAGDTSWQEPALDLADRMQAQPGQVRGFQADALQGMLTSPGPEVIDLNGGYLHQDLQPRASMQRALARAARRPEAWDRPPPGGVPELRDWFAADIGGGLGRHDVLVCGAGQGALATTLRALGRPGDAVVVEAPTYPGTVAAAHAAGLRTVPVPVDRDGLRADLVAEALARSGARVVVVQPLFQNPTGACLAADRHQQLREAARAHGAFVVEDDFARLLAHTDTGPLPAPLAAADPDGTVVHVRSLTKATSPNLRVGAIAARGPVMARLRAAHVVDTMFVPPALQLTALEVVSASGWRRGLAGLATALTQRRDTALAAVVDALGAEAVPLRPRGGYHLWLRLPPHLDEARVVADARSAGVAVTPGRNYHSTDTAPPHLRISYVAAPSERDVVEGVRRLGTVVQGD